MTDHVDEEEGSGLNELRAFLHDLEERRRESREKASDAKGAVRYLSKLERAPHTLDRFAGPAAEADGYAKGSDGRAPFFRGFASCMRHMKEEVRRMRLEAEATLTGELVLGDYLANDVEPRIRSILDLLDLEESERYDADLEAGEAADLELDFTPPPVPRTISEPPQRRAFIAPAPPDDAEAPAE